MTLVSTILDLGTVECKDSPLKLDHLNDRDLCHVGKLTQTCALIVVSIR